MRALLRIVGAVVAAVLVCFVGAGPSPGATPTARVQTCTYNSDHQTASIMSATSERGPPAAYNRTTTYDALDRWLHGVSARPAATTAPLTYNYDDRTPLVRLAGAATTARQARSAVTEARLVAGDHGRVAAETGETAATTVGRDAAESCLNSFTGDTPVKMADGTTKPIKDVKVGEKVLATDPETGETKSEPVVQLIRHSGQHAMVLISLADGSVLDSTDGHPIWDATTGQFTDAANLQVGDKIETTKGLLLPITGLTSYTADLTAYNLQIDQIHTYYAGTTPVLVHNSCFSSLDALRDPSAVEGLTPSQIDDLARNAGLELESGSASAANPAMRYYLPGTRQSVGFRVLPRGVAGQTGIKGGPYLRYFGGLNGNQMVPLAP